MNITIKPWDSFKYLEVWEILQLKDGCIYKTRKTGKYVKSDWVNPDPDKWTTSSISMSLLKQDSITLPLFEG